MHKYALFIVCLLFFHFGSAQNHQDSLWQIWNNPQQADSSRYQALWEISEMIDQADSSMKIYQLMYEKAKEERQPYWMAAALREQSVFYGNRGESSKAIQTAKEGIEISEDLDDMYLESLLMVALGRGQWLKGEWEYGIQTFKQGLQGLKKSSDSVQLALAYKEFGRLYHEMSVWDTAILWGREALTLFHELDDREEKNQVQYGIGLAYKMLNVDDSALLYLQQYHALAEELENYFAMANAQIDRGTIRLFNGEYVQALELYEDGLRICREKNVGKPKGWLLQGIGMAYFAQREHDKALEYQLESLATLEEYPDVNLQIDLMDQIGLIYSRKEDYDQARSYFEKGLAIAQENNHRFYTARFLSRLGLSNFQAEAYEEAEKNYLSSLNMYEVLQNIDGAANVQYRLGRLYHKLENWQKATLYYEQSIQLAEQINAIPLIAAIGEYLYQCYSKNGQFEQALATYQTYIELRDSLSSRKNQRALLKYEFETKALSDSLAFVQEKADSDLVFQQKIAQRNYLIFGGIALAIIGFVFYRYRQQIRTKEKEQELQRERERKEQLAELNQLKSRFFANISHELRTPLTLILGPLSHILDQPDAWEKESVQQQLTVMQRNGKSLMHLIEEILDLSRLEANQLELEEERTDLTAFAEQVFANFGPQFENQQIEATLDLDIKKDLLVLLDQSKTKKVLNNFLANALKFTPVGGTISLSIAETADSLQFKVSDSGRGIHREDLPHVFDRYYQVKSGELAEGGSGIGLSLVKEMAHLMDGQTYAESKLGEGSSFYFIIPKKELAVQPVSPPVQVPEEILPAEPIYNIGNAFTIMVVEDNDDMRSFIHQLLQPMYQRVLLAKNGAEGLALLEEHGRDIHLIVSDIMMPEVDGLSMLKTMKAKPEWNSIPVIMLTALASERDKLSALTIGVDDYLTKPFSVQELLVRVQNLLYNAHQRQAWFQSEEYLQEAEPAGEEAKDEMQISPADKAWIEKLEKLVYDSLASEKMTADTLADAAHLSPRQLRRKLKGITGFAPAKFIKEIQLQKAREQLEEGLVQSLADVAFACGFEHQRTFSTAFKGRFGKSPREYLRSQVK